MFGGRTLLRVVSGLTHIFCRLPPLLLAVCVGLAPGYACIPSSDDEFSRPRHEDLHCYGS